MLTRNHGFSRVNKTYFITGCAIAPVQC